MVLFHKFLLGYLLFVPVESWNFVGLLSALLEPKCPKGLLDGECTCKVVNNKLHYDCDLSFSNNFWGVIEVIQYNGGMIEKLVVKNCKEPLKELDRNFPLIKARIWKIKNCGITTIPTRALSESAQWIDELDLSNNDLESVDFGIHQLKYLKRLDLMHNKITSIPEHTFKFSDKLEELDLSYNRISMFSREAFDKSTTKLKYLDLSNNELSNLPAHFFVQRTADVANEDQKTLSRMSSEEAERVSSQEQSLWNLAGTRTIVLDNNNLKSIDPISFHRMSKLQKLHLKNNRIHRVTPGLFSDNKWLWQLDLSNNNITEIASNAFDGLYVLGLNIHNNPMSDVHKLEWKLNMSELQNKLAKRQMECSFAKDLNECDNDRLLWLAKQAGF
uniref:Uncharacterized protein n=1 Tax=Ditylenchus dipsaci TaxID=166011 RepID=A0A915DNJ0_9BILA